MWNNPPRWIENEPAEAGFVLSIGVVSTASIFCRISKRKALTIYQEASYSPARLAQPSVVCSIEKLCRASWSICTPKPGAVGTSMVLSGFRLKRSTVMS